MRELDLRPPDQIVVTYPFSGIDMARTICKTRKVKYHVLVHDLHQEHLDKPSMKAALAEATSFLCVSTQLVETMKYYNPRSALLYPTPGKDLGLLPGFSKGPIGIAGTLSPENLAILKRFELPIVVLIDALPQFDSPNIQFQPRFADNDDAVRFVSQHCSAFCVIIPKGSGDYETHSFPSKLIDFCRAGIPIIIVASQSSSVGDWAKTRKWQLYIDDEQDSRQFRRVAADLRHKVKWAAACDQINLARDGEFNANAINSTLLAVLTAQKSPQLRAGTVTSPLR